MLDILSLFRLIAFPVNYRADCLFGWLPTTDCGFRIIKVANCQDGMKWGCHSMPVDRQRRAQSRLDSSQVLFRWYENDRTSCRGLLGGGVVAESTRQSITMQLPSGAVKKLSKRMVMRSNCNGSSREFESQNNNELSAVSRERIKILILMFLPPRRVVEPIVWARQTCPFSYVETSQILENFL